MHQKERLARAREGKDGRPPRFDPVLDEVAAKLEKEVIELMQDGFFNVAYASQQVARIKLGETAAAEIGDCLKAKSASQGAKIGKAPVNLGPKPTSGTDNKKVKSILIVEGDAFEVFLIS